MNQLKDMPLTWCREAIKAIRDVKRKYRGHKQVSKYAVGDEKAGCPLCALDEAEGWDDCSCCPWMLFVGATCGAGDTCCYAQSIPDRIARLDRWEATIQDEIKRRTS